jgi:hypothetical protein
MGLAVAVIEIDIAHAASIGVSFASIQDDLLPSDVTGVVPQANWNNVHLLNTPNLLNQQGMATTASVLSLGSIAGSGGQPLTAFDKLFNAEFIMTGPNDTVFGPTVAGIPIRPTTCICILPTIHRTRGFTASIATSPPVLSYQFLPQVSWMRG